MSNNETDVEHKKIWVGWLIGWLVGCLFVRLVGWLGCWLGEKSENEMQ